MPDCILSSQNRFYADVESSFGQVGSIDSSARLSAVRLGVRQRKDAPIRRDKTGSRTFTGITPGARTETSFSLETYLVEGANTTSPPAVGPLLQSGMGAQPALFAGGTAAVGSSPSTVVFASPHNLGLRQGFAYGGEIRFVETINDANTVTANAPFSTAPVSGDPITPTVSYFPADVLPSVSIFDYWDPITAVQRIVVGGAVDRFRIRVNADFHQLDFEGRAKDVIDSVSFLGGQGGLATFPVEPPVLGGTPPPIPGNLGQAWLGQTATKFLTVTSAAIELDNDLDLRNREFGTSTPQCIAPGQRRVTAEIELFEVDDEATRGLYASARSETPIQTMFQLGQAEGQLLGVYLPALTPSTPEFDDGDRVLKWRFSNSRARGSANDEMVVAFG